MAKRVSIRGNARRVDQILRVLVKYGLAEWLVPPALQPQLVQAFEQLTTIHGDLVDVMKIADSTARGEAQHMYLAKVCYAAGHHTPA